MCLIPMLLLGCYHSSKLWSFWWYSWNWTSCLWIWNASPLTSIGLQHPESQHDLRNVSKFSLTSLSDTNKVFQADNWIKVNFRHPPKSKTKRLMQKIFLDPPIQLSFWVHQTWYLKLFSERLHKSIITEDYFESKLITDYGQLFINFQY